MAKLNQSQVAALELALTRLDPDHPGFAGSDKIREHLVESSMRGYMDSHVYPLLRFIRDGESFRGQREYIVRDSINAKMRARRNA